MTSSSSSYTFIFNNEVNFQSKLKPTPEFPQDSIGQSRITVMLPPKSLSNPPVVSATNSYCHPNITLFSLKSSRSLILFL